LKLPRELAGTELAKALTKLGYEVTNQTGSHIRLTTQSCGEHHVTIPAHDPLRIGTLNAILRDVAEHHGLTRDELLRKIFP
jgi:predicted RNA binding protein YcfA (HicA-like mRNA interferase family)